MAVTAIRECWKEILIGFQKYGFTSKELEFDLKQDGEFFKVILTKEFFDFLRKVGKKRECDLGKLLSLKYQETNASNFHYQIDAEGFGELYLIQYSMAVASEELQRGKKKYIPRRIRIKQQRLKAEKDRLRGLVDTALLKFFGKEYRFKMKLGVYKDQKTKEYVINVSFAGVRDLKKKMQLPRCIVIRGVNPAEMIEELEDKLCGKKNRKH